MRRTPSHKEIPKEEPERPKLEKIVEGTVVRRKKSLGKRFKETFLGGSDRSVVEFVIQDVIVPNIRDMVFEAGQQGLERSLYGESAGYRRGARIDPRRGMVNYNAASRSRPEPQALSRRARAQHDFGEFILPTRAEADAVLEGMFAHLDTYEMVTVADLCEMLGQSSQFTDRNWGWTDLRGSDIRRNRDGYLLVLPPTESLA